MDNGELLSTKNSKYVTSWWVELLPNGVYQLLINTTERWIPYHALNDTTFQIGNPDLASISEYESAILRIPEFLPKKKEKGIWIVSSFQNKDQIYYYFMFWKQKWLNKSTLILKSNDTI